MRSNHRSSHVLTCTNMPSLYTLTNKRIETSKSSHRRDYPHEPHWCLTEEYTEYIEDILRDHVAFLRLLLQLTDGKSSKVAVKIHSSMILQIMIIGKINHRHLIRLARKVTWLIGSWQIAGYSKSSAGMSMIWRTLKRQAWVMADLAYF